jgi:hypothetical protein
MQTANRKYQEIPLTFEKGLVINVEDSILDLGECAELINWEPTQRGTLRARNAWDGISTTGLPAGPYKVRGLGSIATDASAGSAGGELTLVQSDTAAGVADEVTLSLTGVTAGNQLFAVVLLADPDDISPDPPTGWTELYDPGATGTDRMIRFFTKTATGSSESITVVNSGSDMQAGAIYEVSNVHTTLDGFTEHEGVAGSGGGTLSLAPVSDADGGIVFAAAGTQSGTITSWTTGADVTGFVNDYSSGSSFRISHAFYAGADASLAAVDETFSIWTGMMRVIAVGANPPEAASPEAAAYYIVIALAVSDTEYELYRILRDEITTGTWELIDEGTASDTTSFVTMAQGAGYLNWSASTMTTPRKVLLSGPTGSDVSDMTDLSGRAYAYHKNRLFSGGSAASPARLHYSAIGDPDTFGALDYLDIGGDDGEAIQDIVSVEGLLLVCKSNRIYLISGSGIESFFVNELTGGTTAPGRAAVRTPYGTIVAGPDDVWVVQGGGVDPLSRPLGADYTIAGTVSTAYAQDHAFILDSASGEVLRVDLKTGAWSREAVQGDSAAPGHLFSLNGRLYYGVLNDEVLGGTRRLDSDRTYDELTSSTVFDASTGKISLLGPSFKYTPRHLFVQTHLEDDTKPNELFVTITTDQGSEEKSISVTGTSQRQKVSLGKYQSAEWIQVSLHAASSPDHAAIDPERLTLGVYVENQ